MARSGATSRNESRAAVCQVASAISGISHLGMREAAILSAVGLSEARRLVPADSFAGRGKDNKVADAILQPFADD